MIRLPDVEAAWGFTLPAEYKQMLAAGVLVPGEAALVLSDTRWLTPLEMIAAPPVQTDRGSLRPFARSARRDLWCWHPAELKVLYCPAGSDAGTLFAPSFPATVYRLLLEELSSTWLGDRLPADRLQQTLRNNVRAAEPFLPAKCSAVLRGISSGSLQRRGDGTHGFIPPHEASAILQADAQFAGLDAAVCVILR